MRDVRLEAHIVKRRTERVVALAILIAAILGGSSYAGCLRGGECGPPNKPQAGVSSPDRSLEASARTTAASPTAITNSIGMRLVPISPGEFLMGSSEHFLDSELGSEVVRKSGGAQCYAVRVRAECPQHRVRITKPYWLAATLTTQEEYERVMGTNPSHFRGDPRRPVETVSWYDAVEFCRKLSEMPQEKAAKRRYQLPTEAQWEYACRAGNPKAWFFSRHEGAATSPEDRKLLVEYAWFSDNSGRSPEDYRSWETHPVAKKRPNPWGLYDIYGNVGEWCRDWHAPYTSAPAVDPADARAHRSRRRLLLHRLLVPVGFSRCGQA
jgi:formylglycine-generating enzyme required for sulfatase activity